MTDALTGRNGVRVSNDSGSPAGFDLPFCLEGKKYVAYQEYT